MFDHPAYDRIAGEPSTCSVLSAYLFSHSICGLTFPVIRDRPARDIEIRTAKVKVVEPAWRRWDAFGVAGYPNIRKYPVYAALARPFNA
jgi:hypothetical protein